MKCANDTDDSYFNYGTEDYDAEGNEEPKVPPGGSETMPYIDESPTMSPQLSARGQEGGGDGNNSISPTAPDEPDVTQWAKYLVVPGGKAKEEIQ
ncbi:UNVERIFIED_CONTAM: hypothetical protein K2H54_031576 [Gekko kuhli]